MPFTKTFHGFIENNRDTLLIIEACRSKMLPTVNRRLVERERAAIRSGTVIVFDEAVSGIKRWTDGFLWSPSRILGNFLVYRELASRENRKAEDESVMPIKPDIYGTDNLGYGNGVDESTLTLSNQRERALVGSLTTSNTSYNFKVDGLIKKTIRIPVDGNYLHIVNYYSKQDVLNDLLPTPSTTPQFNCLTISAELLPHLQGYNNNSNSFSSLNHNSLTRSRKRCSSMDKNHQKIYRQRINSCGSQDLSRPGYHLNYRQENNSHPLLINPHQTSPMGYVLYNHPNHHSSSNSSSSNSTNESNHTHSLPSILDNPSNAGDGMNLSTELPYYHQGRLSNSFNELPPPISNNSAIYRNDFHTITSSKSSSFYPPLRHSNKITYTDHYHSQQSNSVSPAPSPTPSPPTSLPSVMHCTDTLINSRVNPNYYDTNPVVINRSPMDSNTSPYNTFTPTRRSTYNYTI